MYASIRYYKTSKPDEVIRQVNEHFLPLIIRAPGFQAYYLVDAGQGVTISVSIFDSQAGAEESNRLALGWVRQSVQPLVLGGPAMHLGRVVAHQSK